jgi:hypothetical protein
MSESAFVRRRGPSYIVTDLIKRAKAMPSGAEKNVLVAEISLVCEALRRLDDRFLPPFHPHGPRK